MSSKIRLLIPLMWQQPQEFTDRLTAIGEVQSEKFLQRHQEYSSVDLRVAIDSMERSFGWRLAEYIAEPACKAITQQIEQHIATLPVDAPFSRMHNSDFTLAQTCYAFCRVLRPSVVVETGVAYGVTSSFILAALAENQHGRLYSIDLPPLAENANKYVGAFIPSSFRSRWELIRGTSRRHLLQLAKSVAPIDLFIHDSLHTHRNITFELNLIQSFLNRPAAILVDDAGLNSAFADWQSTSQAALTQVVHEEGKDALFAFAIFI